MDSNSKLLAAACHFPVFIGLGIIIPLIMFFAKKDDEFVLRHAKEALASQIGFIIGYFVSALLCIILIGFLTMGALLIAQIVLSIIAGVKALNGEDYNYPLTSKFAAKF